MTVRDERPETVTLTLDELRAIIQEEVQAAFGALKTSSAELYRNGKGERTLTIKQYDTSAAAAYAAAARVFDAGVRDLMALGTENSPIPAVAGGAGMREERA